MTTNQKAVVYCRMTNSSEQRAMLNAQEEMRKEITENDGYKTVEFISDIGSGIDPKRRGLKKLIRLAKKNKIGVLYTIDSDSISKSVSDLISLQRLLEKNGTIFTNTEKCELEALGEGSQQNVRG